MKNILQKVTILMISVMLLFIASAHSKPAKFDPVYKDINAKIAALNKKINKKTTNKARLQRERDKLLRQLKELFTNKKANNPSIVSTPKG